MQNVIVLNRNYEYWTEVSLNKVLKWMSKDKIEIVVSHDEKEVGSVELRIKMPIIVRLIKFIGYKPRTEVVKYSQEAVFQRDDNFCMYWHFDGKGKKFKYKCTTEDRTIDHVTPLSRNGKSGFENEVCACRNCNEVIKRNKTPDEAGLELIRKPFVPRRDKHSMVVMRFSFNPSNPAHRLYKEKFLAY